MLQANHFLLRPCVVYIKNKKSLEKTLIFNDYQYHQSTVPNASRFYHLLNMQDSFCVLILIIFTAQITVLHFIKWLLLCKVQYCFIFIVYIKRFPFFLKSIVWKGKIVFSPYKLTVFKIAPVFLSRVFLVSILIPF